MLNWKQILTETTIKLTTSEFKTSVQLKDLPNTNTEQEITTHGCTAALLTFKTERQCFDYIKTNVTLTKTEIRKIQLYNITDQKRMIMIHY